MSAAIAAQPVLKRLPGTRFRLGAWVAIGGIVMLFTSLASAYIVRSGSGNDWQRIAMPRVLWISGAVILVSSLTMEITRRSLRRANSRGYVTWLLVTMALGMGFVASQVVAWRQLARQGVFLASNPHSSFFYLFTGVHGIHILGGLVALGLLLARTRNARATVEGEQRRVGAVDAATIYWHFMDGLWLALFYLLFFWR